MDAVRIAHLSDLHFTPRKDFAVWREVARFINDEVRPDFILITGDVTDNAKPKEFELALQSLDLLATRNHQHGSPKFRIVPGNHDRYELFGNRLWWWRRYKKALYEHYFGDHNVSPLAAADLLLEAGNFKWKIRVIGLDSNFAKWFAQGAIDETHAVEAGRAALAEQAQESDLVIALVHHHVLAIPEVERRVKEHSSRGFAGITAVANVTGMLNSGVLLRHLSRSQVNLVLHGHEHQPNQAVFRDAALEAGPTVVLAAGSATGEKTGVGWALDRVHFNVLELHQDRSVRLLQAGYNGTGLSLQQPGLHLIAAHDIRRARFVRRYRRAPADPNKRRELPTSRLKTVVFVNSHRNADFVETTTIYLVDKNWTLTTRCRSGFVETAKVNFEWADGDTTRFETDFLSEADDAEAFTCGVPQPMRTNPEVNRITARWRWVGCTALTRRELEALPAFSREGLRSQGREYVSISIDRSDEFESAALTLHLPDAYAPDHQTFQVDVEDLETRKFEESKELYERLEFSGPGHVELRIAYPLPGHRYFLSWIPISDDDLPTELSFSRSDQLSAAINTHLIPLFDQASVFIRGSLPRNDLRVGLYGNGAPQYKRLLLLKGDNGSPPQLELAGPRSRNRAAFWGTMSLIDPDRDADQERMDDERVVALLPVRPLGPDAPRSAALLRVAVLLSSALNLEVGTGASADFKALLQRISLAAADMVRFTTT
jgi:3',5'-cyclic AMP phosphodiesterase CpdA